MKKIKYCTVTVIVVALILFVSIFGFLFGTARQSAYAAENGIYTSLSISIDGGDGKVRTIVRNDITIFPSTVMVRVELYSSETYQESYTNMTLEQTAGIDDLNMGKTITAEANTNGVKKYWQGRVRYRVDNGAWKDLKTSITLFDANGTLIEII